MSRIDQLISQYCPAGVPMVRLGEVCKAEKAKNKGQIIKDAYSITQSGLVRTSSFFKEKTHVTSENTSGYYIVRKGWFVYSPSRIDVGSINFLKDDGPVIVSPIDVVFSIDESKLLQTYLLSYLLMPDGMNQILSYREGVEGTGRRSLPFKEFSKISIPLPPLPVQEEIVRILDAMSDLVTNLDAEISARQKQYEHAREKLLTFGEEVEKVPLNDVASHYTGLTYKPDDVSESGTLVLRSSNIQNSHIVLDDNVYVNMANIPSRALVKENDILVCVRNGSKALIGKSAIIMKDIVGAAFGAFMTVLRAERIHYKFLFYIWQSRIVQEQIMGDGGAPINQITNKEFAIISIPLPSLSVQQSIVERLDKMESLIQNLQAERDLRQKQYEYYREKLLTFE